MSAQRTLHEEQILRSPEHRGPTLRSGAHKRAAVKVSNIGTPDHGDLQKIYDRIIGSKMEAIRGGHGNRLALGQIAELFVAESISCHNWFQDLEKITQEMEKDPNNWVRELGKAIDHHANQLWAARHLP